MRRFGLLAGGLVAVLLLTLVVNTLATESRQLDAPPLTGFALDTTAAAERLAGALRFETTTQRDPAALDSSAYQQLFGYLRESFPRVHETLQVDTVSGLSRLYTWPGRDTSLAPIVIMGHTDVVPVRRGPTRHGRIRPSVACWLMGSCGAAARWTTKRASSARWKLWRGCYKPGISPSGRCTSRLGTMRRWGANGVRSRSPSDCDTRPSPGAGRG